MSDLNSTDITNILKNYFFKQAKCMINNSFVYSEESDFLIVNKNYYTQEFEVKISRSDFKADFIKNKHTMMNSIRKKKKKYVVKTFEGRNYSTINYDQRRKKLNHLTRTKVYSSGIMVYDLNHQSLPNKFSFIVPDGLVSVDEIPEYAGLYYIVNNKIKQIKNPPFLHRGKFDLWEKLAIKYYYKTTFSTI